ncbi:MAG: alpha/beta hydrolase family protein [Gemmatimonadaceae bacterium]
MADGRHLKIDTEKGPVSAILDAPDAPRFVYVLAHGAGVGMQHAFMQSFAKKLTERSAATLRYQFPYMEAGKSRVDSPDVAVATVLAAARKANELLPATSIIAGGKSFGGRMTSEAQSRSPLPGVRGLAFLGYPLHPPGKPGTSRADHLKEVDVPMLFLQGTKDEFAQLDLLQPVITSLGERASLELIEGGDHSFKVPKSTGRSADDVMNLLCDTLVAWAGHLK